MHVKPNISTRLLFMLSLSVPAAFLPAVGWAVALPTTQSVQVSSEQNQPFIKANFRHDTLADLHQSPSVSLLADGTGKESSEKDKDSSDKSDKSKDACDSRCGRGHPRTLTFSLNAPADLAVASVIDGQQTTQPNTLFQLQGESAII